MVTSKSQGPKKPTIKIAAHVVIQLGQELVTDVEQAFLELAKNAYDADSEDCTITIEPQWRADTALRAYKLLDPRIVKAASAGGTVGGHRVGRVLVTDTGIGATDQGVTEGWLTISASLKRSVRGVKPLTGKQRTPVGDKGLGRLATMKIGDLLLFRTAQEGEALQRVTAFSWSEFERARTIDQVFVDQWTEPRKRPYAQGSEIEIVGLHERTRWLQKESIEHLIARLSQLVNPYKGFKDFDIHINDGKKIHALQKMGGEVLNFAAAEFTFKWDGEILTKSASIGRGLFRGSIGEDAKAKYEMAFSKENFEHLKTKFRTSSRLAKRGVNVDNPSKNWLVEYSEKDTIAVDSKAKNAHCGAFEGKVYYFMFNEDFKNKVQGNSGSAKQVQEMSGVLVFRDGFRVRIDEDWLGLAEGTTSGNFYSLRPKNTLGYFAVTNKENPNLIEKSDREGFLDNAALRQFMSIATECKSYANAILLGVRGDFNELSQSLLLETTQVVTARQARMRVKETSAKASSEMGRVRDVAAKALARVEQVRSSLGTPGKQQASAKEMAVVAASITDLGAGLKEVQTRVEQMDRAAEAIEAFRKGEADKNLRLLDSAAVGLSARILSHELMSYVDTLDASAKEIAEQTRRLNNAIVNDALANVAGTLRELRKSVASLDPLLPGSRTIKETMDLAVELHKYVASRKKTLDGSEVVVRITGDESSPQFKFGRTRLYQILENLLQNSLYWLAVQAETQPSKAGIVRVAIREDGFDWSDTGPGINERYEDSLFDAFISSKPRGEGQGLGLYIVSTFLESERCSISLLPSKNAGGRRYKFRVDISGAIAKTQ